MTMNLENVHIALPFWCLRFMVYAFSIRQCYLYKLSYDQEERADKQRRPV
jgi:hypothetical protein